jgi:hypothetical protein
MDCAILLFRSKHFKFIKNFEMVAMQLTSFLLSAGALVSAAPASLDARASCTFTDAATAIKNKASCTTIIIEDMTVPAGTTLDLTKLTTGTTVSLLATTYGLHTHNRQVTFQRTLKSGYNEWEVGGSCTN